MTETSVHMPNHAGRATLCRPQGLAYDWLRAVCVHRRGKTRVTKAGSNALGQGLQRRGGFCYLVERGIKKRGRNLRVHKILHGTNEILRGIVARDILENR